MNQITCIQIDNFGPFTEEMGNNREHKIQILLSEIFVFLQKYFNQHGGLVFSASKDNMLAVSNNISLKHHQFVIDELEKQFPVTVSMGIGVGSTPIEAQFEASRALISQGSAQSSRRKVLAHNGHDLPIRSDIKIVHVDINYYTKLATDVHPFYRNFILLNRLYLTLMEEFEKIGALCFFNGGDNFVCVCPLTMMSSELEAVLYAFEVKHAPWKLKAGMAVGSTILEALSRANSCLKEIREENNKIKILVSN